MVAIANAVHTFGFREHLQVPVQWQGPAANTHVVVGARDSSKSWSQLYALAVVGALAVGMHY